MHRQDTSSASAAGPSPLDQLPFPFALIGADRRIVDVNMALIQCLARRRRDLIGEALDGVLEAACTDAADGPDGRVYRICQSDAESWYRLEVRPAGDGGCATLVDVSTEYAEIERLRTALSTRERLLHDAKVGTWRVDPDTGIYRFSSELALGYDDVGAPVPVAFLETLQHPDDRQKDREIRERITTQGGSAVEEMRYQEAGGAWTHLRVHYRAGPRAASGLYEMYGLSQDITPMALARDEAKAGSSRLRMALRGARAGVFEFDYAKQGYWMSSEFVALATEETLAAACSTRPWAAATCWAS